MPPVEQRRVPPVIRERVVRVATSVWRRAWWWPCRLQVPDALPADALFAGRRRPTRPTSPIATGPRRVLDRRHAKRVTSERCVWIAIVPSADRRETARWRRLRAQRQTRQREKHA